MAGVGLGEVKLIGGWASPFVLRPRIALNLKGVEYELLMEKLGTKSELLVKSNPVYKKIPVLLHNGKPICESMVIVQYVDEVWAATGPSILPADPYDRAISRFWAVYIDDKFSPSVFGVLRAQTEEAKAEAAEQVFAGFQLLEEAFENCSKGKPFFGGGTVGYVDIALGCLLGWIKAAEKLSSVKLLDETKAPKLVGWARRFCSDDAVKDIMPETDRLIEFSRQLQGMRKAPSSD